MMKAGRRRRLLDYIEDLYDPRIECGKPLSLLDIIAIAICAFVCGADKWAYVEMFGQSTKARVKCTSHLGIG